MEYIRRQDGAGRWWRQLPGDQIVSEGLQSVVHDFLRTYRLPAGSGSVVTTAFEIIPSVTDGSRRGLVMDPRFDTRLQEMLAQAQVSPEVTKGLLSRLETFVLPFTAALAEPEQRRHTVEYLTGLVSSSSARPAKGSPTCIDQERQGLQKFIGQVPWSDQPLLGTLARQVGERSGRAGRRDRVRPLGLRQEGDQVGRRGTAVVRPARQGRELSGRHLHGICLAQGTCAGQYASLSSQGMDEGPSAVQGGRGPKDVRFRTRHELALEMLDEQRPLLPHAWVAGDDEMGRPADFRRKLRGSGRAIPAGGAVEHVDPRHRGARRRNTRDEVGIPRTRSCGWIAGAPRCRSRPGRRSRSATARRGRW